MKTVYFACSITGGRRDEEIYQHLVKIMLGKGWNVPTVHNAATGLEKIRRDETPCEIYQRDVQWIQESDLLVAEVSTPSHGVGYEICYALDLGKPVLCLHQKSVSVSKMITGNTHNNLLVKAYQDLPEADKVLKDFLEAFLSNQMERIQDL